MSILVNCVFPRKLAVSSPLSNLLARDDQHPLILQLGSVLMPPLSFLLMEICVFPWVVLTFSKNHHLILWLFSTTCLQTPSCPARMLLRCLLLQDWVRCPLVSYTPALINLWHQWWKIPTRSWVLQGLGSGLFCSRFHLCQGYYSLTPLFIPHPNSSFRSQLECPFLSKALPDP